MSKKMFFVAIVAALMLVIGCAPMQVTNIGTKVLPDGSTVDFVGAMSPDAWGIDGKMITAYRTTSVYDPQLRKFVSRSEMVAKDTGFSDGLGKKATVAWGAAAISGGSMVGAAAVLRPDNTNVSAGNNSGNMAQNQGQSQRQRQNQNATGVGVGGQGGQGGSALAIGGAGGAGGSVGNVSANNAGVVSSSVAANTNVNNVTSNLTNTNTLTNSNTVNGGLNGGGNVSGNNNIINTGTNGIANGGNNNVF